ncbi:MULTISPECIES: envelope stress response membrane protein PspB [Idiomarinaceae]|uniref:Phage shock protein B n=4 Tax=Pseudidiomarina TaxID=2800384 RepID=A0A368V330_9GAMM|nr:MULTISPECIES: envelope stress response membrane protein PspB [Idiomarinaceae]MDT7524858.1 envelope stress response membrane protein PspB [Pseudidiomarina sp. GXY010]MDX1525158.1 envelope stress response membrane protein PspB [Pseudidiomarina maritima]MRJ40940.1 envelope stress response membrane protein PspB [Idiomarina sp. FeN1]NCU56744.1 envelope stress response membrane protein PspB [Idiomarina sp. FenA--70]NCU59124.1 envelope stress response membrane protein PspB [Idiomarina sp. FenBw--7
MDLLASLISAPIIIFMVIVAPLWIIMHYRSQRKLNEGLSQQELLQLQELAHQAERMQERIKTLEAILDAEAPQWRNRV